MYRQYTLSYHYAFATKVRFSLLFLLFLNLSVGVQSQTLNWAFNSGGASNDGEFLSRTHRDASGNLYQCGIFSSWSMDVDPGGSVYNLSNQGGRDGFVAWYSPSGALIGALQIGGAGDDGIYGVATDAYGNIYITGYYNGTVDFDPSPATFTLAASGFCSAGTGEPFVAKYTATGAFVWAFGIASSSCNNYGASIAVSPEGSVYVCGVVNLTSPVDFDPSSAVYTLNGANGFGFVAKYNTTGQFQWAFNIGGAYANSVVKTVRLDHNSGSLFVSGHVNGACDMDPSPTGTFTVNGSGENPFVARYDTNMNFQFALNVQTPFVDEAFDMALDNDNVYLSGIIEGANIDFDPGAGSTSFNTNGQDIFVAKYTKTGLYRWAHVIGGGSSDWAMGIAVNGGHVYSTGSFSGTVDFDPSAGIHNMVSAGQGDGYLLKQDTAGNFVCAFRFGGAFDDVGYHLTSFATNQVLLTGNFQNSVLMTSTGLPVTLGSNGSTDLLMANYTWDACPHPDTVINKYAAVLAAQPCNNTFTVDTAEGFNAGDTVLIIQMKGAVIDTSNTAAFGTVLDYRNAGNYEVNVVDGKTGNDIRLKYKLERQYNIPDGKVQLVCIPHFQSYTVNKPHSCMPWNGSKGGVFAIDVAGALTLNDNIDVSGKGFRGGAPNSGTTYICDKVDFFYPESGNDGGRKGEGISEVSASKGSGRGAMANGGGGGNSTNAGGGGGGNGGAGGMGGYQWTGVCAMSNLQSGIGGRAPDNSGNRIFLGGGGGAGHENNFNTDPGGNGGGIILVMAGQLNGNGHYLQADGADCDGVNSTTPPLNGDGQSGGGAGGSVMLDIGFISQAFVNARGGGGGNVISQNMHGPGGGGGGGVIATASSSFPSNVLPDLSPGAYGTTLGFEYGAQYGTSGQIVVNNYIPVADTIFVPGNVIPDFSWTTSTCRQAAFTDLSVSGIAGWQWSFGDNTGSSQQNPSHTYAGPGSYQVKLVVTDSNGCKDSITKTITLAPVTFANAGPDTSFCAGSQVILQAAGGIAYQWNPVTGLSNPSIANPAASPSLATNYVVTVTDANGCEDKDTVLVTPLPGPEVVISPDEASSCSREPVQLNANGAVSYVWSPVDGLSDPHIPDPVASPTATTIYTVVGTDDRGCTGKDFISVTVRPAPLIDATSVGEPVSCQGSSLQLLASGALTYTWHPGAFLSDSSVANPIATPPVTTLFTVEGRDAFGCLGADTITVRNMVQSVFFMPDAFTPNNDGRNDRIYPIVYCEFVFRSFHIYNRWGQRVFSTARYRDGWDGRLQGADADMGTYYYYIEGSRPNGEPVLYKGSMVLIR